ncbi:neutral zinc metallopeptidase [Nonomuraea longicatena]
MAAVGTANTANAEVRPAQQPVRVQQAGAQFQQQAAPRGRAAAMNNPLYRSGRLADSGCAPGDLPRGSTAAYRKFLQRVTNCLNATWSTQFRKARIPFTKPRLRIVTGKVRTACGPWSSGADGIYCPTDRTMYMLITKKQLRQPYPLGISRLMAHEYGHHVQQISGIWSYYWSARSASGKSGQLLLSRRSELQAECFSAAFMSTVQDTLPVDPQQWEGTVDWFHKNGHKAWAQNDHGRGPTQATWMRRGFQHASPGACNTWKVSPRYVS